MHPTNSAESFGNFYWLFPLKFLEDNESFAISLECFLPLPLISGLIAFFYKLIGIFNCAWCQTHHLKIGFHLFGPFFQSHNYWLCDHCGTILILLRQISVVNSHQLSVLLISRNINWGSAFVSINVIEDGFIADWVTDIGMGKKGKLIIRMLISGDCE